MITRVRPSTEAVRHGEDGSLLPGRLPRQVGPPKRIEKFTGFEVYDERLAEVLPAGAKSVILYQFTLHGEGTIWDAPDGRLAWSDVPNRRLLGWYPAGHVEVLIDNTGFMIGNALGADGVLVHCEHGRRCISRSDGHGGAEPVVTPCEGCRLNSPNDVMVAADGATWFAEVDGRPTERPLGRGDGHHGELGQVVAVADRRRSEGSLRQRV